MGEARVRPRRRRKIFLAEWREACGLTQIALGLKLKVAGMTVSRWETGTSLLNTDVMDAIADALQIEPEDLYHRPDEPTANALLRDQDDSIRRQAIDIIRAIRRNQNSR